MPVPSKRLKKQNVNIVGKIANFKPLIKSIWPIREKSGRLTIWVGKDTIFC